MNIQWYISPGEAGKFANSCEAVIRNVGRGTRAATEQACKEILEESLKQVPRDTGALASTGFYEVKRRDALKGYVYEGIIGYAGQVGEGYYNDTLNPKSGMPVSTYSTIVHEDLEAWHIIGNAKFLENPVREYAHANFRRVAETHWMMSIETFGSGGIGIIPKEV
jgi:hypothetical protein